MTLFRLAILTVALSSATNLLAETYYVDSTSGDDSFSGTAATNAWKTLARVNGQVFQPGDKLLFKAGTRYSGQLKPQGTGAMTNGSGSAILISKYGDGPLPRIDGEGKVLDTVLLRNTEFWDVQDLEITNQGEHREPWRTGVSIVAANYGKMRHIHLRNLFVHDVNGDLHKEQEGCGIFFINEHGNDSHFDDVLIENCHVVRTDRNGICQRMGRGLRSLHVVIRNNLLEDIGGDGIKIWGSNGALVAHNIVRGARRRCEDAAAGIWPFDADDTVIQFNEVSGMKGITDGQGLDSDYRCRRTIIQYNYSHDNEGGFMLVCTPGNSYNEDTIIRYNISQNDGINSARVFHFAGGAKNTQVYNNTIYVGTNQDLPLIRCSEWSGGNASGTRFYNNIFYVDGRVTYNFDKSRDTVFENNVFCGNHVSPPTDEHAITNCPPLVKPGGAGNGFETLSAYKIREADFPKGKIIPNNGGRDLFGNKVSSDEPSRVGAVNN